MRPSVPAAWPLLLSILVPLSSPPAHAAQVVAESTPADGDRVTFRVPIAVRFASPLDLDADGDGTFTRVDSAAIDAAAPDVAVEVNAPWAGVRVRLETAGGTPVAGSASWQLRDYPPLLRVTPADPLARDTAYRLVVFDGADPGAPRARRASDGAPVEPYAVAFRTLPQGAAGQVTHRTFTPPSLGYAEDYNVYTPPGYGLTSTQRYPVLYLLHGGFGTWADWEGSGHVSTIVNRLVDAGTIEPLIVVMPDGNSTGACLGFIPWNRLWSNSYNGQYRYGDYVSLDLPNHVEAQYRARTERRARGVGGLSMGGFGAASVGLGHPARYAFVAPLSAWQYSVRMTSDPHYPVCDASHWTTIPNFGTDCFGQMLQTAIGPAGSTDLAHMKTVNGRDLADATADETFRGAIFVGHGDADTTATVTWSDDVSCGLEARGTAHCFKRVPGAGHTWDYWSASLEFELLPRFMAVAIAADLPAGIDEACVNATRVSPRDADLDGVPDQQDAVRDNCRDDPNADQADLDADGSGDACDPDVDGDGRANAADCAPRSAAEGTPPPAVVAVDRAAGGAAAPAVVRWSGLPSADAYDVARGTLSALRASGSAAGSCFAPGVAGTSVEDAAAPGPADGFWYLVRGVDAQCGGAAGWGAGSDGAARPGAVCP